jgi:hypothetical protein
MAPVPVVLELPARAQPAEAEPAEITAIDMEDFSAANKCSCAASDDNPY